MAVYGLDGCQLDIVYHTCLNPVCSYVSARAHALLARLIAVRCWCSVPLRAWLVLSSIGWLVVKFMVVYCNLGIKSAVGAVALCASKLLPAISAMSINFHREHKLQHKTILSNRHPIEHTLQQQKTHCTNLTHALHETTRIEHKSQVHGLSIHMFNAHLFNANVFNRHTNCSCGGTNVNLI